MMLSLRGAGLCYWKVFWVSSILCSLPVWLLCGLAAPKNSCARHGQAAMGGFTNPLSFFWFIDTVSIGSEVRLLYNFNFSRAGIPARVTSAGKMMTVLKVLAHDDDVYHVYPVPDTLELRSPEGHVFYAKACEVATRASYSEIGGQLVGCGMLCWLCSCCLRDLWPSISAPTMPSASQPLLGDIRVTACASPCHRDIHVTESPQLLSSRGQSQQNSVDQALPPESYCPITHQMMHEPVLASDGVTYERAAIERWLAQNVTSPMTNTPLTSTDLIPNRALRSIIERASGHGQQQV